MRLLVLGGTRFLGRHVIASALDRGHAVTLFHRGTTHHGLFSDAEELFGDRDGGLAPLRGRTWDAVVDTCGFVPRVVGQSARLLRSAVAHYTFVSSCSVYADASRPGIAEDAPVETLADPATEQVTGESYGGLKALCERECAQAFGDRALIVRAGLIVGPHDYMDRFAYWPRRVAAGGDVLAPGNPDAPVQLIDVRDLAGWIVRSAETRLGGTFNATGPDRPLTMGEVLATCRSVTASEARFIWVDEPFLLERDVAAYSEMPLWVPSTAAGFNCFDCRRANAAGLTFRALHETMLDTWEWDRPRSPEQRRHSGPIALPGPMTPEREATLLAAWGARASLPRS